MARDRRRRMARDRRPRMARDRRGGRPRPRPLDSPAVTSIKERLAAGETLFGSFLALGSPLAAEALGLAGFDWLLVDLEHGGGHEAQALGQLLGAKSAGVPVLARVESANRSRA